MNMSLLLQLLIGVVIVTVALLLPTVSSFGPRVPTNRQQQQQQQQQQQVPITTRSSSSSTLLYGIKEWRSIQLSTPTGSEYYYHQNKHPHPQHHHHQQNHHQQQQQQQQLLHPVTILSKELSTTKVLVPGEITYLHFVTKSEIAMFHMAMEQHYGILGLGLLIHPTTDDNDEKNINNYNDNNDDEDEDNDNTAKLITSLPLLEIQDYKRIDHMMMMNDESSYDNHHHRYNKKKSPYYNNNNDDEEEEENSSSSSYGIFCTAKVVGRAKIHQLFSTTTSSTSTSTSSTTESSSASLLSPSSSSSRQQYQHNSDDVTTRFHSALVYEVQDTYDTTKEITGANQIANGIELLFQNMSRKRMKAAAPATTTTTANEEEENMNKDMEEIEDEDDYMDEDDDDDDMTPLQMFWDAYEEAIETDYQEYLIPIQHIHGNMKQRSWRQLKAISWAACAIAATATATTSSNPSQQEQQKQDDDDDDTLFRIDALYTDNIASRLQLVRNHLYSCLAKQQKQQKKQKQKRRK